MQQDGAAMFFNIAHACYGMTSLSILFNHCKCSITILFSEGLTACASHFDCVQPGLSVFVINSMPLQLPFDIQTNMPCNHVSQECCDWRTGHLKSGAKLSSDNNNTSFLRAFGAAEGELKQSIEEALGQSDDSNVEQRIHKLLNDNPVMLFMKGTHCNCLQSASRLYSANCKRMWVSPSELSGSEAVYS